jgi:ankyrin repeat protein
MRVFLFFLASLVVPLGGALAQEKSATERLTTAIRMGDEAGVRAALKDGADAGADSGTGITCAALAITYAEVGVVRAMIESGVDLAKAMDGPWDPLEIAVAQQAASAELVEVLIKAGFGVPEGEEDRASLMRSAGALRNGEVMRQLVAAGCKADARIAGWSILAFAAYEGTPDVVGALIQAGAGTETPTPEGQRPLHLAAVRRDANAGPVIAALIAGGADVSGAGTDGWTALRLAAASSAPESVRALVKGGAAINEADETGMTPLLCAAAYSDAATLRALIELGAGWTRATAGRRPFSSRCERPTWPRA